MGKAFDFFPCPSRLPFARRQKADVAGCFLNESDRGFNSRAELPAEEPLRLPPSQHGWRCPLGVAGRRHVTTKPYSNDVFGFVSSDRIEDDEKTVFPGEGGAGRRTHSGACPAMEAESRASTSRGARSGVFCSAVPSAGVERRTVGTQTIESWGTEGQHIGQLLTEIHSTLRVEHPPHVENPSDSEEISDEEKTGRRKQIREEQVTHSENPIPHPPAKRVLIKKKVPRALKRLRNPSGSEGNDDNEKIDGSEPDHFVGKWRLRKRRILLEESNTRKKISRSRDVYRFNLGRRKQIRNEHVTWSQSSPLDVRCGTAEGILYKEKLARGISEKSIQNSDGKWFTPVEFETEGGRGSCKSWKRSIFCNGITLEKLIISGVLPNPPRKYGRRKKRENIQQTPHSVSWKKKLQRRYHQSSSSGTRTSPKEGQKESTAAENDQEPQEDATAVSMPSSSSSSPMQAVACSNRAKSSPKAGQKESTAAENNQEPQEDVTELLMPCLSPMQAVACCSRQEGTTCSPSPSGSERDPVLSRFDGGVPSNHFPVATSADPPSSSMESSKPVARKPRRKFFLSRRQKFFTFTPTMGVCILRSQNRLEQVFRNTLGNRRSLQVKIQDITDHLAGLQQQQEDLLKALKKRRIPDALDLHRKMESIIYHQELLGRLMQEIIAGLGIR